MMRSSILTDVCSEILGTVTKACSEGVIAEHERAALAATAASLSAVDSLLAVPREAGKLATFAQEALTDELAECSALADQGVPVRWCIDQSFGQKLWTAAVDMALAEIIARRMEGDVFFDEDDFEVVVTLPCCHCGEPHEEIFDLLDTAGLVEFLLEHERLLIAERKATSGNAQQLH